MKITWNHSKIIWKSDFKSFSPFRIVGMVVHMLDPAVWEVNGVGSHLKIKQNLGIKLHCLAALPSCLVANSYPWSWFLPWFSRFYWFPWFPYIVCSTYPWSCPVLALFMAKVSPRVCVRNSIFKAETINIFKMNFNFDFWAPIWDWVMVVSMAMDYTCKNILS